MANTKTGAWVVLGCLLIALVVAILTIAATGRLEPPAKAATASEASGAAQTQPFVAVNEWKGEKLDELVVSPGLKVEYGKPIDITFRVLADGAKCIREQIAEYKKHPATQPSNANMYFDSTYLLYGAVEAHLFDSGSIRRVFSLCLQTEGKVSYIYTQTTILAPDNFENEPPLQIKWNDWKAFDAAKQTFIGIHEEPIFWLQVNYYTFSNGRPPSFSNNLKHEIGLEVVPKQWKPYWLTPTSYVSVPVDGPLPPTSGPTADSR